jgi:hypothetical protein
LLGAKLVFLLGLVVAVFTLDVLTNVQNASAQTPPNAEQLNQELDRLFELMLRDPTNLDLMFQYAQTAVLAGDYDAAIGTLLRMLLFNPDLPRVRLELGALYLQVGSYEAARTYLTQALQSPTMPPEIRARAEGYLAEIERRTAHSTFSGTIAAGVRWQSNATAGPASPAVRALGQDATLSNEFTRQADWNLFALSTLQHVYDFKSVRGDTIESTLALYGTRQDKVRRLDVALAEATTGPRLRLGDTGPGLMTVRPYALANIVMLDDARYYNTFGGGIALTQDFGPRVQGEIGYERREKRFNNTSARPTASDQDSGENVGLIGVRIRTSEDTIVSVGAAVNDDNAREPFRASRQYGATAGITYFYDPRLWTSSQPWTANFAVSRVVTDYDAPDPGVDPDVTRHDREWRFGVINSIPVVETLSVFTQVQRFDVDSNLPNFKYDNWALSAGLSWRF